MPHMREKQIEALMQISFISFGYKQPDTSFPERVSSANRLMGSLNLKDQLVGHELAPGSNPIGFQVNSAVDVPAVRRFRQLVASCKELLHEGHKRHPKVNLYHGSRGLEVYESVKGHIKAH
jgi:hypothetical protein